MQFIKHKKDILSLLIVSLFLAGIFTCHAFAMVQASNASASFEVSLDMQGDTPQEQVPFTFVLVGENGAPVPSSSTVTITGEGTAKFGVINFTNPGEYVYHIYERDDGVVNYIYDNSFYTINVYVKYDNLGNLVATYNALIDDAKKSEIAFVNKYNYDSPIPQTPDDTQPINDTEPINETEPNSEATEATTSTVEETTSPSETGATETTEKSTSSSVQPSNNPTTPTSGSSNSSSTPKTGDYTNNILWMSLLCVAIIGMIGCLVYIKVAKKRCVKQDKK
jgi:pilin isopeptide linkage protein